jgi:hypothetical protein
MVGVKRMYGIWDSRTDTFYARSASYLEAAETLDEEVEDLVQRGVDTDDITEELNRQLIETDNGRAYGVFGYELLPAKADSYVLAVVEIV